MLGINGRESFLIASGGKDDWSGREVGRNFMALSVFDTLWRLWPGPTSN